MSAALGLGVSAMAAVVYMQQRRRSRPGNANMSLPDSHSTCASARVAETITQSSAVDGEGGDESDPFESLWGLTDEGEAQMKRAHIPASREHTETVRLAKEAVRPRYVESLGTKGLGRTIPVIGRDVESAVKPKVSGGCMFYMSDRYTRALEEK